MKSIVVIIIILLLVSVAFNYYLLKRNEVPLNIRSYSNGHEYIMLLDKKLFFKIGVSNEGNLDYYVSRTKNEFDQVFHFIQMDIYNH